MKQKLSFLLLLVSIMVKAQVANLPSDLSICDDDNDGFGVFDLSVATPEVLGGQNPADYTVTYYETITQAEIGASPITGMLYSNVSPYNQVIYVRVEEIATGNYATTTLNLVVNDAPNVPTSVNYTIADNYGALDDGIAQFDLTTQNGELLSNVSGNVNDYVVTYYLTEADANNQSGAIANVMNYVNTTNPETVYANVQSVVSGCFSVAEVILNVSDAPEANNVTFEQCDDDYWLGSGITPQIAFDLTIQESTITSTTNVTITYHVTNSDAVNDQNTIVTPTSYVNTINPQTLFVRVEDNATGAYSVSTMELIVLSNPTPMTTQEIADNLEHRSCVNNGDGPGTLEEGYALFNLLENIHVIIFNVPNYSGYCYLSEEDAILDQNQIVNPTSFYNTIPFIQTIYVRVVDDATGCVTIVSFEIEAGIPQVSIDSSNTVVCLDANGIATGTLPVLTAIATNQSGTDTSSSYTYQWSLDGVDITGATDQNYTVIQPGTYGVTVTGITDAECTNYTETVVESSQAPASFNVSVTSQPCDDTQTIEATVSGNGTYEYSIDNGNFTTDNIFTNVAEGTHDVTIRDASGCWQITTEVIVTACTLPNTNFNAQSISETCVDTNNGAIVIEAAAAHNYEASLSLNGNTIPLSPNTFTESLSIYNLAPGTYYLCITIPGTSFNQCFDVYVEAVENLDGFSNRVGNTYTLSLTGSTYYEVAFNEETFVLYATETSETIVFEELLNADVTMVSVTTDKDCQGKFEETIYLNNPKFEVFPNPVNDYLTLSFESIINKGSVEVYAITGRLIDQQEIENAQTFRLPVSELSSGLYLITVKSSNGQYTTKFVKQ